MTYFVGNRSTPYLGVMPPQALQYLGQVERKVNEMSPLDLARRIRTAVTEHDQWRARCLNLMANENVTSLGTRYLMSTYFATRATEGFPGDKEWPPWRMSVHVDEVEAMLIALVKGLFGAEYVEWRATSNNLANMVVFFALTQPGDAILVQSMPGGANMNYHQDAIPRIRGLTVETMPVADYFNVDVEGVRDVARRTRPRMLVIGGSKILFPFPLAELRIIADEVDARIMYDAAHVSALIAAGLFQRPLADGADVLTMGTHKIMGGPHGGLALTNDPDLAKRMLDLTFPAFVQAGAGQGRFAAAAYALAELVEFGGAYARQVVANARALAEALEEEGFRVLARERKYTMTHQIFLDLAREGAAHVEEICQAANILFHQTMLPVNGKAEVYNGARVSVQEPTRLGMKEAEMREIARLIRRVVRKEESPLKVAAEVRALSERFQVVRYSFDEDL